MMFFQTVQDAFSIFSSSGLADIDSRFVTIVFTEKEIYPALFKVVNILASYEFYPWNFIGNTFPISECTPDAPIWGAVHKKMIHVFTNHTYASIHSYSTNRSGAL